MMEKLNSRIKYLLPSLMGACGVLIVACNNGGNAGGSTQVSSTSSSLESSPSDPTVYSVIVQANLNSGQIDSGQVYSYNINTNTTGQTESITTWVPLVNIVSEQNILYSGGYSDESNGFPVAAVYRYESNIWQNTNIPALGQVFSLAASSNNLYASVITNNGIDYQVYQYNVESQWTSLPLTTSTSTENLTVNPNNGILYAAGIGYSGNGKLQGAVSQYNGAANDWSVIGTNLGRCSLTSILVQESSDPVLNGIIYTAGCNKSESANSGQVYQYVGDTNWVPLSNGNGLGIGSISALAIDNKNGILYAAGVESSTGQAEIWQSNVNESHSDKNWVNLPPLPLPIDFNYSCGSFIDSMIVNSQGILYVGITGCSLSNIGSTIYTASLLTYNPESGDVWTNTSELDVIGMVTSLTLSAQ